MVDLKQITCYFPQWLCAASEELAPLCPEEFRLRAGQKPMAYYGGFEHIYCDRTLYTKDLEEILLSACRRSCYAVTDQVCEGYVTVSGGHRFGICGTAVIRDAKITNIKEISSLCVRIAQDYSDSFDLSSIQLDRSCLIIGRAGSGKTTLLRACIKKLSERHRCIGIVDSRGEIASVTNGISRFPLGMHADVLSGVKMADGLLMLLRSMRPVWLCADEITAPEDIKAMELCSYCGAQMLTTAHAASVSDLKRRPLYRKLLELGIFEQVITIRDDRSIYTERVSACSG